MDARSIPTLVRHHNQDVLERFADEWNVEVVLAQVQGVAEGFVEAQGVE